MKNVSGRLFSSSKKSFLNSALYTSPAYKIIGAKIMGATGVKIVAANLTIVKARGTRAYIRSKTNLIVSPRLQAFHSCVRQQMQGKHGSQADIRASLAQAARSCAGGGRPAVAGRRMTRRF